MVDIINVTVSCILGFLFLMGIVFNSAVKKKYNRMFSTITSRGRDKDLLKMERNYRHAYLKEQVDRIDIFVERQYYGIRLFKLPLYVVEDMTLNLVYIVCLIGATFSLILFALPSGNAVNSFLDTWLLAIEGFIYAIILMVIHSLLCIHSLRRAFKVKLCHYLNYDLELYDDAERDEEGHLFFHKDYKARKKHKEVAESTDKGVEHHSDNLIHLSKGRETKEDYLKDFDDEVLLQILDEIMGS